MNMIRKTGGFTLVETIVAISILMLGTLGPLYLAQRNIKVSREAEDRIIASFLAQEGVEIVRNVIANNSADNQPWLQNVAAAGSPCAAQDCVGDIGVSVAGRAATFTACGAGCPQAVLYRNATGLYRQPNPGVGWTASRFRRQININYIESAGLGKRIVVTSTVTWGAHTVAFQEDVYNWYFQLN